MTRAVSVTVRSGDGSPLPGAVVCVNDRCGATQGNGRARIEGISTDWHQVELSAAADGHTRYSESVNLDPGLTPPFGDVEWPDLTVQPLVTGPLPLQIETGHFMSGGARWIWKGCTDFLLYQRFLDGQDITPIVDERLGLGANLFRVLGMCHNITRFYPQECPGYYERWPEFAALLAAKGAYFKVDAYADEQHVKAGKDHFKRLTAALVGLPNALLSLGNEYQKNGFNPSEYAKPSGILFSFGSSTSDTPPPRRAESDFLEFHGRRGWAKVLISSADPAFCLARGIDADGKRWGDARPFIHDEPMGFDEVEQPGRRSTSPELARVLAADSVIHGDGATFHPQAGLRSEPMGPIQQTCARAFYQALDACA